MNGSSFEYDLEQRVSLLESGETGTIVGRAEYTNHMNQYFIRYKAGDGRQVESWWAEDAIIAVP